MMLGKITPCLLSSHSEIIDRRHPHLEEASGQRLAFLSGTVQGGQHQLALQEVPGREQQRIPGSR
jgi:hypothetical protein